MFGQRAKQANFCWPKNGPTPSLLRSHCSVRRVTLRASTGCGTSRSDRAS